MAPDVDALLDLVSQPILRFKNRYKKALSVTREGFDIILIGIGEGVVLLTLALALELDIEGVFVRIIVLDFQRRRAISFGRGLEGHFESNRSSGGHR